jgi:hypothetical protein
MIQTRRNVFETNSSSSHSITIADSALMPSEFEVTVDDNGDDVIYVDLVDFCSSDHESQNDKLAYLIEQIAYITNNEYALNFYGSIEENEEAQEALYHTTEFLELEDQICAYADCKHIRINPRSEGYIDHDSVVDSLSEWEWFGIDIDSYLTFVFAKDSWVHFEFNG